MNDHRHYGTESLALLNCKHDAVVLSDLAETPAAHNRLVVVATPVVAQIQRMADFMEHQAQAVGFRELVPSRFVDTNNAPVGFRATCLSKCPDVVLKELHGDGRRDDSPESDGESKNRSHVDSLA